MFGVYDASSKSVESSPALLLSRDCRLLKFLTVFCSVSEAYEFEFNWSLCFFL